VVLLAAGSRRARAAALLPVMIGAAAAVLVVPRGGDWVKTPIDPVARALVCDESGPRVCVARVHAKLLPEAAVLARQGLGLLAKLPNAPTEAAEDTSTFADAKVTPQRPGTALFILQVGGNGHLTDTDEILQSMLRAGGAGRLCPEFPEPTVAYAAGAWLMGREPDNDPAPAGINEGIHELWQGLSALPEAEAVARVAAVRDAALACRSVDGLLTKDAR
jgi:hypothetical protein